MRLKRKLIVPDTLKMKGISMKIWTSGCGTKMIMKLETRKKLRLRKK